MKLPLVMRVLRDVFADKTRQRISEQEVSTLCRQLVKAMKESYVPDLVVPIATGGSVPGEIIAQILGVPVVDLVIRRDIKIIRRYSLDPIPLRWMMSIYHHYLFQTTKPTVSKGISANISGKRVLIVEDMVHTGATIDIAVEYLKMANVSQIKTASLGYVSERRPDFLALPSGNYCFPWSKDYNKS